jgi:poly(3-hydroxybutyrate) depolymerase
VRLARLLIVSASDRIARRMIYQFYQAQSDIIEPIRALARVAVDQLAQFHLDGLDDGGTTARLAAVYEIVSRLGLSHRRPDFGIATVPVGNGQAAVLEEAADETPFCTLLHFRKEVPVKQPRVLLVAPLSGHFATLLRDTVRVMLPDHDLYLTDWHNARDVSLRHGRFGLDEYIDHLIRFMERLGPGAHMVAICQPAVPALAATALMAADGNQAVPASLTLMAGPIDTRINPTKVNEFSDKHPIDWFERNLIGYVPFRFAGAFRRVYPGFLQLAGFMSMNLDRHLKSFGELYQHLIKGETDKADAIRVFYDEYFAVMDLAAEFYLETVHKVFQTHELPLGDFEYRGRKVILRAIRSSGLFTVEGERDDICAVGQTLAAQELCTGVRPYMRRHHVQTGVGHYGVFAGRKWATQIYPQLRDFIYSCD